jgi:hypothetical protein
MAQRNRSMSAKLGKGCSALTLSQPNAAGIRRNAPMRPPSSRVARLRCRVRRSVPGHEGEISILSPFWLVRARGNRAARRPHGEDCRLPALRQVGHRHPSIFPLHRGVTAKRQMVGRGIAVLDHRFLLQRQMAGQ